MTNWRAALLFPGYPGVIVGLAIWLLPESPRWLLMKYDKEAATVALQKLRSGDVSAEIDSIVAAMEEEASLPKITFSDIRSDDNLRSRCIAGIGMQVAQQMTGVNCFLGFSTLIFRSAGITDTKNFNVWWTGIAVCGNVVGVALMDSKFGGRRLQLLLASALMILTLGCAAATHVAGLGAIWQKLFLAGYAFAFQSAWGLVPWVYPAEIFSMNERAKFVSLTVFSQYLINTLVNVISPFLVYESLTLMYSVFGCFSILNLVFVIFFVKETKGVPLEQVKQLFGGQPVKTMPA